MTPSREKRVFSVGGSVESFLMLLGVKSGVNVSSGLQGMGVLRLRGGRFGGLREEGSRRAVGQAEVGGQGSPPLFGALHWGQVTMISLAHPRQSVSALRDLAPRLPCPVKHSLTPIILGPCGHRPCTLRLDGESVLRQSWPLLRPLQPWGQGGHSARRPGPQLGFPRSAAVRQYLCRDAAVQGFSGPW